MPGTLDSVIANAIDDVKADVITAVKAHPQYAQIVAALAEKAIAQLAGMV